MSEWYNDAWHTEVERHLREAASAGELIRDHEATVRILADQRRVHVQALVGLGLKPSEIARRLQMSRSRMSQLMSATTRKAGEKRPASAPVSDPPP